MEGERELRWETTDVRVAGMTDVERVERIKEIVDRIEGSVGYAEDENSVWLGPWLYEIKACARGLTSS